MLRAAIVMWVKKGRLDILKKKKMNEHQACTYQVLLASLFSGRASAGELLLFSIRGQHAIVSACSLGAL